MEFVDQAWFPVMGAILESFNTTSAIEVLTFVAAMCVGLAFMWWGVRKATSSLMSAFRKGKVSL